jgi:hypothetical protein
MSFINPIAALTSFLSIGATRNFAGFSGYVTIQESTTDVLEITQQPVQQGASIADHAFKKPISLSIQMQFNTGLDIPLIGGLLGGVGSLLGLTDSLSQIYQNLLSLQTPVAPNILSTFTVMTLKRTYNNMLLTTLGCTTDKKTENVLSISATFQECITVPLSTGQLSASFLKDVAKHASIINKGKQSGALTLGQGIVPGLKGVQGP